MLSSTNNPLVIYHANCPDGFAAAMCAWLHFNGQGEYLPMVHAQELPDMTGRDVYMLDIAFSHEKMEQANSQANQLIVLDHHQSARDDLTHFKCRCGKVSFNLEQSGARMAWEYFNPGKAIPALIAHVEDRDLLQWLHEDTPSYLAALDVGPYNFHRWAGIMTMPDKAFEDFMTRGKAMHAQSLKLAKQLADEATDITINGVVGKMANAPNVLHSAVGDVLLTQCNTYALMWCLEEHGTRVKVGLRGAPGFDTIPLARSFGGGGHAYASAFRLPLSRLGELVQGKLESNA